MERQWRISRRFENRICQSSGGRGQADGEVESWSLPREEHGGLLMRAASAVCYDYELTLE